MLKYEQFDVPEIAAIAFDDGVSVDDLLEQVAGKLRANGFQVAGYLQRETPETDTCCSILDLESIASGAKIRISQVLGRGARGCRLDFNGLAKASGILLGELEDDQDGKIDLLILNRFGKGEADGQGFRSVIQKAMELNIPVLTAVRQTYRLPWDAFGGEFAGIILPDQNKVMDWCQRSIQAARLVT